MHLNIKNDEAHKLASSLAKLTGESLTTAVTVALRDRLEAERRRRGRGSEIADRLMALGKGFSELPDAETIDPDQIVPYDEFGVPQ